MKIKLLLSLLLICGQLVAQTFSDDESTTRALVIGISDYQEDRIPDLRFADRDAQAFATFLQSPAGGSIPTDQITLMTNEEATTGAIAAAMDWLIADSQEGDKVIIYFSGHGDVETRTKFQRGFLLTYDSPPSNYLAGAFALIFLQDIISTLSDQGVQVVMISDACRAGKLAGSEIGGAQATAANLSKQFANEIKILSCQPDEFSLEGEQWGGGRGAFSYHLIDGLTGMADGNGDLQVNLFEAGRYLEDKVPTETAPQMQIPMTIGKKSTIISLVDEASLAEVKARKAKESPSLALVDTRGIEEEVLAQLDSIPREKYQRFVAALEKGFLLEPKGENAYDLYQELSKLEPLGRLKGVMLRNLAAKLQEESQQAINAYLRGDEEDFAARTRGEARYSKYVQYLRKAAELLGEKHYMYQSLKAKQFYFDAVDIRYRSLERTFSLTDSSHIWQTQIIDLLNKALKLEPNAAFIIHDLGFNYGKERIHYYKKAAELAPNWIYPYANMSAYYRIKGDLDSALLFAQKVYELAPETSVYPILMYSLKRMNREYGEEEGLLLKAIEIAPGNITYLRSLAYCYYNQEKYLDSEKILLQILELSPADNQVYNFLSEGIYLKLRQYDKAEAINRKRLEMRPTDGDAYADLISGYWGREPEKIKALITEMEAINERVENWEGTLSIAKAYQALEDWDTALKYYEEARQATPNSSWVYYSMAGIYRDKGEYETFLNLIDTAFMNNIPLSYIEKYSNVPKAYRSPSFKGFAEKTIKRFPKNGFGYMLMGKYYEGQGDFARATKWFQQAVTYSPTQKYNWRVYGTAAYANGEKDTAQMAFQKYLDHSDQLAWNYNSIGYFYRIHSEDDLAKKYLNKGLMKDSTNSSLYFNKAWVIYSTQGFASANALLEKAIGLQETDSGLSSLFYLKGLFEYYSGYKKESINSLKKAADKNDRLEPFVKAIEKVTQNDFENAIHHFEEAMEKNPGSDNIKYIYCQLKIELGDIEGALNLFDQALAIGGRTYDFMANDPKLDALRKLPKFKALMKKYFPEKYME